jgi:4-coumarate--CoA ligase
VSSPGVEIGGELEEEIMEFLAQRVAGHKRLRGGVRFVDEILKSAAGKILRRILKEKYQQDENDRALKL